MRKTVHVTRLTSSSSSSFAFPVRASPITTRRCSPTVDRFTYKFNKHISYLMHALSRECFDRPGPSFSSSTRSSAQPSPRANSSAHRSLPSTLGFALPNGTACRKYRKPSHARLSSVNWIIAMQEKTFFSRCRYNVIVVA